MVNLHEHEQRWNKFNEQKLCIEINKIKGMIWNKKQHCKYKFKLKWIELIVLLPE